MGFSWIFPHQHLSTILKWGYPHFRKPPYSIIFLCILGLDTLLFQLQSSRSELVTPIDSSSCRRAIAWHGRVPLAYWNWTWVKKWEWVGIQQLHSGKRLHNYGKSPYFIGTTWCNYKWAIFNSKLLVYQRLLRWIQIHQFDFRQTLYGTIYGLLLYRAIPIFIHYQVGGKELPHFMVTYFLPFRVDHILIPGWWFGCHF